MAANLATKPMLAKTTNWMIWRSLTWVAAMQQAAQAKLKAERVVVQALGPAPRVEHQVQQRQQGHQPRLAPATQKRVCC